ncbi:hypothetical protein [Nocardioides sp. URHA0032]|uniref:hypothetical protein n=1 Tax=Nocardioides sp. URHA0032 TaxID=1380388 RepID=UPI00048DB510|nr:hypothetical protein [Nocardioides sp. URHA0032]
MTTWMLRFTPTRGRARAAAVAAAAVAAVAAAAALGPAASATSLTRHAEPAANRSLPDDAVWPAPQELSVDGQESDSPAVATDNGSIGAVWRTFDGAHWRIQSSTYLFSGRWSAPVYLSPARMDASTPQVAVFESRAFQLAAWVVDDDGTDRVQVAVGSRRTWSKPQTVTPAGEAAVDPIPVILNQEDPVFVFKHPMVFWRGFDGTNWRIQGAAVSDTTGEIAGEIKTFSAAGPAEDLRLSDGTLTWSRFDGTFWRAQWMLLDTFLPRVQDVVTLDTIDEDMHTPAMYGPAIVWTNEQAGVTRLRALMGSQPQTLSSAGADVIGITYAGSRPALVGPPADAAEVVWQEHSPGPSGVTRVAAVDAGGPGVSNDTGWGDTRFLSAAGVDTRPAAASGPGHGVDAGPVFVTWPEQRDGAWGLRYAANERGTGWTTPTTLGETAESADASDANAGAPGSRDPFLGVAMTRTSGGTSQVLVRGPDLAAPHTTTTVKPQIAVRQTTGVSWLGQDDWSPIATYDVQRGVRTLNGTEWKITDLLTATTATSTAQDGLRPGSTYCYRARATDAVGRVSPWPVGWGVDTNCATVPLDDRVFAAGPAWKRQTGAGYYHRSLLATTRQGATLRLDTGPANFVYLVVATGPTAGRIQTRMGFERRTINLKTTSTKALVLRKAVHEVGNPATGILKIRVLSDGKPVRIDGVAVRRN